jgi:type III secretion protein T
MLYLVEGVLGLINRFAQQLNVFSLSQSLKTVTATWIILVQVTTLIQLLQDDILTRGGVALGALRRLYGG